MENQKMFLIAYELRSNYMNKDRVAKQKQSTIVFAESEEEAINKLIDYYNKTSELYYVFHEVIVQTVTEAIR